jgi:poly(hydroxyalkanoate) depolymerase family esterase
MTLIRRIAARFRTTPAPQQRRTPGWLAGVYRTAQERRRYRLFVPSGYYGQALPLLVLLHGCEQTAEEFANATGINALAERESVLVLYPEQALAANRQRCWNWFHPGHQERGRGEPGLLAGLTRHVIREYAVDPSQVWVAGLSAGGAMAVVLGATYPELFAAVGCHSGLPYRAAETSLSAWTAMRFGNRGQSAGAEVTRAGRVPRLIVFHGDVDETVDAANARLLAKQWLQLGGRSDANEGDLEPAMSVTVRDSGGHAYTRSIYRAAGQTVVELWIVHGLTHAWSGGVSGASHTDSNEPSAGEEMLRFFLGAGFNGSADLS